MSSQPTTTNTTTSSEENLSDGSSLYSRSEGGTIREDVQGLRSGLRAPNPSLSSFVLAPAAPLPQPLPHPHLQLLALDEFFGPSDSEEDRSLPPSSSAAPPPFPPLPTNLSSASSLSPDAPQLPLVKAGNFGLALEKLDSIAAASEKLRVEFVDGASFTKHLRLAGELEKLQLLFKGITKEEFGSLADVAERKIVVATRWEAAVKAATLLCMAVKVMPEAHPTRSKIMRKEMVRVLETMEKEAEMARQAVEWFCEQEFQFEGKTVSKGAHFISQITRAVEQWKNV